MDKAAPGTSQQGTSGSRDASPSNHRSKLKGFFQKRGASPGRSLSPGKADQDRSASPSANRRAQVDVKMNFTQEYQSHVPSNPAPAEHATPSIPAQNAGLAADWVRPSVAADTEIHENVKEGKMPLTLFAQKRAEVRSKRINWGAYLQSGVITQEQFDCIIILDRYSSEKRAWIFRDQKAVVALRLIEMLNCISKDETLQYLLTLIDDCFEQDRTRIQGFHDCAAESGYHGWTLFMPFLNRKDLFVIHQAARIIAKCACWSKATMDNPDLSMFLIFLKLLIRSTNNDYRESTTRVLQMMLRVQEYRFAWVSNDGITVIINALGIHHTNFQLQYQLIFCLWVLTFDAEICAEFVKYRAVQTLGTVLANSLKEKVTRIVLATFRNLLEKPTDTEIIQENAISMIHGKVVRSLEIISKNHYSDPELEEDIKFLMTTLEKYAESVSSYDTYVSELKSGNLEWTPAHKSDGFWRENAAKFSEGNYELLKILVQLMERSKDPLVLSVAIHDIGQYIRFHPRGKAALDKLGGKERAMALLSHEDSGVRYQALMAVQKIMIQNWEFLGKSVNKEASEVNEKAVTA